MLALMLQIKLEVWYMELLPYRAAITSINISRFSVELAMNSLIGSFTTNVLAPDIPVLSLN